jgi:urease accessory protein
MDSLALLLLADGRFPAGGHAHSGGLEAAVRSGRVTGLHGLAGYLRGRLATAGPVTAAFAAAAHHAALDDDPGALAVLDAELDARTPSPALRTASRRQGRALVRAGRVVRPSPTDARLPARPHHPVALGVTAAAAGLSGEQAAMVAAYGVLTGPAGAAVRLLGLDPYEVQAVLATLASACEAVAAGGAATAAKDPAELPAATAPLTDISAEHHATWEVRLFAS